MMSKRWGFDVYSLRFFYSLFTHTERWVIADDEIRMCWSKLNPKENKTKLLCRALLVTTLGAPMIANENSEFVSACNISEQLLVMLMYVRSILAVKLEGILCVPFRNIHTITSAKAPYWFTVSIDTENLMGALLIHSASLIRSLSFSLSCISPVFLFRYNYCVRQCVRWCSRQMFAKFAIQYRIFLDAYTYSSRVVS